MCRRKVIGRWWLKVNASKKQNVVTEPELCLWTSRPKPAGASSGCHDITACSSSHWLISSCRCPASFDFYSGTFSWWFSSGLPRCIMGTEVSHQVSTTVALSSVKPSVTTVTNTQVSGRSLKKKQKGMTSHLHQR